jgi:DNA polymerase-1
MTLPNIRKMFKPDQDHIIFEADLAGADAQVVAWDADDADLKHMFRNKLPVHWENAKAIFGAVEPRLLTAKSDNEVKAHPELDKYRQYAKVGVHATNYGCKPPTLASHLNITVPAAAKFQEGWFRAHPAIARWIERTEDELMATRTVHNAFGYKRYYFDRVDEVLPQALAWRPQSTVAICINKGMVAFRKWVKEEGLRANLLLQVHDSFVGQVHKSHARLVLPHIQTRCSITIPYADPLTIPLSLSTSDLSWGDCKSYRLGDWEECVTTAIG